MSRLLKQRAYFASMVLALLSSALLASPKISAAQVHPHELSVDSILARLESDGGQLRSGYVQAVRVLTRPDSFPSVMRDSLLDGMERLALASANTKVRGATAAALISAASDNMQHPILNVSTRLYRIYAGNGGGDSYVRRLIRAFAPRLADRSGTVRLLRLIAIEEDEAEAQALRPTPEIGEAIPVREAIESLSRMGAEGQAVLRELHRSRRLRSDPAKERLDQLSRQGFDFRPRPE